jgi:hypothetical protein
MQWVRGMMRENAAAQAVAELEISELIKSI